jgi:hypothetical protein
MRRDYFERIVKPTGMSANKWDTLRRWCRHVAKETGTDLAKLYTQYDVMTAKDYEAFMDKDIAKRRKAWRERKRKRKQ